MISEQPSEQDQQFPFPSTFSVQNLRAFELESSVELSRINLVFGANSSGKSTLGKAMLALSRLQDFDTMHRLISMPSRFSSRLFSGRKRVNVIESTLGSRMETLSFGKNSDPIKLSISTNEYEHDAPGGNLTAEFMMNASSTKPIAHVELLVEDLSLAKWSEEGNTLSELGLGFINEVNGDREKALRAASNPQGSLGFSSEKNLSDSSDSVCAADIVREVIGNGLGAPPRYGLDEDASGEIRRLRSVSANVNQLIKSMGAKVRITDPRADENSQLYDEASGLVLGLGQVGSGIGQLISVAARLDRATTAARDFKKFGSRRFPFLLIQEPEAHLHPLKQAEIGEMLCREALKNPMRLVIETHSDALLFRCLKLIRRGELRHDLLRVIFVEQDARGRSTARNLQVGPDGALLDPFPIGFLDWGLEDLIGQ